MNLYQTQHTTMNIGWTLDNNDVPILTLGELDNNDVPILDCFSYSLCVEDIEEDIES